MTKANRKRKTKWKTQQITKRHQGNTKNQTTQHKKGNGIMPTVDTPPKTGKIAKCDNPDGTQDLQAQGTDQIGKGRSQKAQEAPSIEDAPHTNTDPKVDTGPDLTPENHPSCQDHPLELETQIMKTQGEAETNPRTKQ